MTNWLRRIDDWLARQVAADRPPAAEPTPDAAPGDDSASAVAVQVALAEAAKPEYRERYAREDADATAAFTFSCSRDGAFLRIDVHGQSFVVNTAFLHRVDLHPGRAPDNSGIATATTEDWRPGQSMYVVYWRGSQYVRDFPRPARDAEIIFVGVDLSISTPHSLGRQTYNTIVNAIAKGTTP